MHDVSDGGVLVAIAEMALAGKIGARIGQAGLPDAIPFWFGEDQARYLIAAPFAEAEKIVAEARAAYIFVAELGKTGGDALGARRQGQPCRWPNCAPPMKAGFPASWRAKKFRLPTEKWAN